MAGLPKWQQPLAERAAAADEQIRVAARAAGGGTGAMLAVAAGDRELAELCREVAERTQSPLLQQLLQQGARALAALADHVESDVWAHTACDADPVPVVASAAAADEAVDVPAEMLDDTTAPSTVDEVAEAPGNIQAAVPAAAEPVDVPAGERDLEERRTEAEWVGLTVYRPGSAPPEPEVLLDGVLWHRVGHTQVPDRTLWRPVDDQEAVQALQWCDMVAGHVVAAPASGAEVESWQRGWSSAFGDVAAALNAPPGTSAVGLLNEVRRLHTITAGGA